MAKSTTTVKQVSPMREVNSKLAAASKSKIEALRKQQAIERKALREKHKEEVTKVRTEAKTQVQGIMQKMIDELMRTEILQTPEQAKGVVAELKPAGKTGKK